LDNELLTDDGSDWNKPILRLNVKYRTEFDQYTAYGKEDSNNYIADDEARDAAREMMIFSIPPTKGVGQLTDFGKAHFTKQASSEGYSEVNWETYTQFSSQPTWGSWRDRFLIEHKDFYAEYTNPDIGNHELIDETKVKPQRRDEIYGRFYEEYQQWDKVGGLTEEQVKAKHDKLRAITKEGMTYNEARYRVEAYDNFFPENLIDDYVTWFTSSDLERPEGYEGLWFEDDWWLLEHKDFYAAMYATELWKEQRDFSKVPSREIFALYLYYSNLPPFGNSRLAFRQANPDLDSWLVLRFGYKPASAQKGRILLWQQTLAEELTELDKRMAEMKELLKGLRK